MGILIDTGVFIRWERDEGKINLGDWAAYGEPAISVITQSELMVGVHRVNTSQRRSQRLSFVQAIVANASVLPVDSRIAEVHARIVATLKDQTENNLPIYGMSVTKGRDVLVNRKCPQVFL